MFTQMFAFGLVRPEDKQCPVMDESTILDCEADECGPYSGGKKCDLTQKCCENRCGRLLCVNPGESIYLFVFFDGEIILSSSNNNNDLVICYLVLKEKFSQFHPTVKI